MQQKLLYLSTYILTDAYLLGAIFITPHRNAVKKHLDLQFVSLDNNPRIKRKSLKTQNAKK